MLAAVGGRFFFTKVTDGKLTFCDRINYFLTSLAKNMKDKEKEKYVYIFDLRDLIMFSLLSVSLKQIFLLV